MRKGRAMKTLKSLFKLLQLKSVPDCKLCLSPVCRCWSSLNTGYDFKTDWYIPSAPLPLEEVVNAKRKYRLGR